MIRLATLLLILIANLAGAADVRYTLAAYKPGTTQPIATLQAGQPFDLAVKVQDLRPGGTYQPRLGNRLYPPQPKPRGVFAAYVNVTWKDAAGEASPGVVNVDWVQYRGAYRNGRHNAVWPDSIRELGAFGGTTETGQAAFDPLGRSEREVVRVGLTAILPGQVTFEPSVRELARPAYATVVWFAYDGLESSYVPPDRIEVRGVTLTIE